MELVEGGFVIGEIKRKDRALITRPFWVGGVEE